MRVRVLLSGLNAKAEAALTTCLEEKMRTVLIIEDEEDMLTGLEHNLRFEEYKPIIAADGKEGLEKWRQEKPDLVLLDLMLPKISGLDVLKKMRASGDRTPVIILTAKGLETDKVIGLELGADDYLTKPFGLKELLARIKAVLRRTDGDGEPEKYTFDEFTFDFRAMEAYDGEKSMTLTKREYEIMRIFLRRRGEAISRQDLIAELWEIEGDYYPTTRTVDNYIVKLRKKLGDNPEDPKYIHTIHGVGYKFTG